LNPEEVARRLEAAPGAKYNAALSAAAHFGPAVPARSELRHQLFSVPTFDWIKARLLPVRNWIANNQLFLLSSNAQCRVFAESVKVV
jgi:hypothetical protein